jgi:pSer/pThr/pTyr-binding forkhead associated (FHA) protein
MSVRLVEAGEQPGTVHEVLVNKGEFVIGRGKDCDLQINEAEISRHHCMLRGRAEQYTLVDLGSANGTYLNGNRLISQATLQDGDELRLGKHHFRVVMDEREGVLWGTQEGVSATDNTFRMAKIKAEVKTAGPAEEPAAQGENKGA